MEQRGIPTTTIYPACRQCEKQLGAFTAYAALAPKIIALMFCGIECRDAYAKAKERL